MTTVQLSSPPFSVPSSAGATRRIIGGATVGKVIDWYDFGVCGFVAAYINTKFFSRNSTAEVTAVAVLREPRRPVEPDTVQEGA
jgi:hypothetical protein